MISFTLSYFFRYFLLFLQLSEGHPICAVCGRGDLDTSFPEARGCYDTKVTSWRLALEMSAEAVNGPTTGSSNLESGFSSNTNSGGGGRFSSFIESLGLGNNIRKLPEFSWEKAEKAVGQELLHEGQPERFNFEFERQAPGGSSLMMDGDGGSGCGGSSHREVNSAVLARV
jgi:Phospholipase B